MSEQQLLPSHPRALDDLATYLARARHADPGGAARLQGLDLGGRWVLAVTVCPLGGGPGLPVALGLRVLALEESADVDATVPLSTLLDRLARDRAVLPVPPVRVLTASWAGISPPRDGWVPAPPLSAAILRAAAARGADAVSRGADRAPVWSTPVRPGAVAPGPGGTPQPPSAGPADPGPPAAAAVTADLLGFLPGGDVAVARSGLWWRLSTPGGHVLTRPAPALTRG